MEQKIIKTLESLKAIKPSEDFARYSKASILASSQKTNLGRRRFQWNLWDSVKFASALTLGTLLVLVVAGGLSYFNLNLAPTLITELNQEGLLREANSLDFEIHLSELNYYDKSAKEVAALLDRVSQDEVSEL
ncbi:MAG: hypothetical protein Q8O87_00145 [bacterium]|nr:hypothetical protein [bacterium]